jgi:hypothetical protein
MWEIICFFRLFTLLIIFFTDTPPRILLNNTYISREAFPRNFPYFFFIPL